MQFFTYPVLYANLSTFAMLTSEEPFADPTAELSGPCDNYFCGMTGDYSTFTPFGQKIR